MNRKMICVAVALLIGFMGIGQSHGQEGVNLLENGGFETGEMAPWTTYGSVATEVVQEAPIEGNYCLHLDVTATGANFWDVGLQHRGHSIFEQGKKYTLSAFLKCGGGTLDINFKPEQDGDPWTGYGEQVHTMTEEWEEYSITTPVFAEEVNPASITLHIGFEVTDFWIDHARFYEGDYVEPELGLPQLATRPNPEDGAYHEDTWITLSWKPGAFAVSHDVYLGEDFDIVSDAMRDSDVYRGNQTSASYVAGLPGFAYPDGLVPGTTYYWRIDEVNAPPDKTIFKGDVWSFSIRIFVPNIHAIEMKGVSYTAWQPDAMLSQDSNRSLAKARADGCNWIALCVWWFQNNVSSTTIESDYTRYSATPESVVHAINQCHEQGMKVMLKPMVDCRDGDWRGDINPSDDWFSAYQEFISFWAQIAEEHQVELFCIGCELTKTVSWSSSWKNIIRNTRTHYTGPLIYAANHGNEKNVGWWNDLDYIGIDAYYPLTNKNDPTLNELKTAWENRANSLENWLNSNWQKMKIVFAEVGYQSVDGTNRTPWWTDPSSHTMDFPEQAECYEALLSVCRERSWWLGAFWWNWETDPDGGGEDDPYWTPMNKPAEDIMISHYQIPPDLDYPPTEDFESGDFSTFDWMTYGDEYWVVTSDEFNSGDYSAQAGSAGNNESSSLEVTLDCIGGDINFYFKVSSESNFDKLIFRIDGVELANWSGELDWTEVSYMVSPGTHIFEWAYEKDGSVSEGRDTAWIDDIIFPVE